MSDSYFKRNSFARPPNIPCTFLVPITMQDIQDTQIDELCWALKYLPECLIRFSHLKSPPIKRLHEHLLAHACWHNHPSITESVQKSPTLPPSLSLSRRTSEVSVGVCVTLSPDKHTSQSLCSRRRSLPHVVLMTSYISRCLQRSPTVNVLSGDYF